MTLETQIVVGANSEGVATGLEAGKKSLENFAQTATNAGAAAGKGIASVGEGGEGASKKVETATRSMIGSIQRQIAATEAGGQSSRKYQESLAALRGIDASVLKPYLDTLDAAKAKQEAAAASAQAMGASINGAGGALSSAAGPLQLLVAKIGNLDSAAQSATSAFSGMAKGLLLGAAAGLSISAITGKISSTIQSMADLKTASEKTGASVENLSKLNFINRQAGGDLEGLSQGLIKLSKGMAGAEDEGKSTGRALAFLGISAKDASGNLRDSADVYTDIAKKLDGYKDGAGKTALAVDALGKAGAEQLATMKLLAESGEIAIKTTTAQP